MIDAGSSLRPSDAFTAILPAWSAKGTFSLDGAGAGGDNPFCALAETGKLLGGGDIKTVQSIVADYDINGFKAAAVTMTFRATSVRIPEDTGRRYALTFSRPFVVVAASEMGGVSVPLFEFMIDENSVKEPTID